MNQNKAEKNKVAKCFVCNNPIDKHKQDEYSGLLNIGRKCSMAFMESDESYEEIDWNELAHH